MGDKYELVPRPVMDAMATGALFQVRALQDLKRYGVKAGDLGGYVEGPHNLSQEGHCWVEGKVMGNAVVEGNAFVGSGCTVYGDAKVSGETKIHSKSRVYGSALVSGVGEFIHSEVFGTAKVTDCDLLHSVVAGDAVVSNMTVREAYLKDGARVEGDGDYLVVIPGVFFSKSPMTFYWTGKGIRFNTLNFTNPVSLERFVDLGTPGSANFYALVAYVIAYFDYYHAVPTRG